MIGDVINKFKTDFKKRDTLFAKGVAQQKPISKTQNKTHTKNEKMKIEEIGAVGKITKQNATKDASNW